MASHTPRTPQSTLARAASAALFAACLALALAGQARAASMVPPYPYRAKEFTIIFDGTQFHLFYMRHNYNALDDSTEKDLGHAVSNDLVQWTQLAPVLAVRPTSWDNFHIWSPHLVKRGSTYLMFYTGVTNQPGSYVLYQRIGLAISSDLSNWTRLSLPIFGCTDVPWTYCDPTSAMGGDFRDCFVLPDPAQPGRYLMYYATRLNAVQDQMVAAVASSQDLTHWIDEKPMWNTDWMHSFSHKIESPCVFEHNGIWYMFYTTDSGHPINFETSADPMADSTGWSNQIHLSTEVQNMYTDSWYGPEYFGLDTHDYFCAVNGIGIEFHEMVWTTPPHFVLTEPVLAVQRPAPAPLLELRLARAAPAEHRWVLEASTPSEVRGVLEIVDVSGRRVHSFGSRALAPGITRFEWDGTDAHGRRLESGIYLAVLRTPLQARSVRLAVLR